MSTNQLAIRSQTIVTALCIVTLFLLLISMAGQTMRHVFDRDYIYGLVPLFNVDMERNIPTFFTMLVALANSLLLVLAGLMSRARASHEARYWFALAFGFLFLAYDEGFQVHEKLIVPMREMMGPGELGIFYFAWVIPGIIGVCVLALIFLKFLLQLPSDTRRSLLIAAGLYLSGCLGLELLNGAYREAYAADYGYSVLVTVEEGLEMAGLIMLMKALFGHLGSVHYGIVFVADAPAPQPDASAVQPHFG